MNTQANEPWLEALQGRATATDRETLEAQGMRQYFEARLAADLQPLNDPMRERRLRNLVEAHVGANALGANRKPAQARGPLSAWLHSWNLGWPALGASAAAVVLGVLIGPMWQSQHSADEDWATPNTPPSVQPGSTTPDVPTPKSFDPNAATSQQEFAEQLRLALSPLGLEVTTEATADGMRISANIPQEQQGPAAQALKPLGLTVPVDGRLRVLVR